MQKENHYSKEKAVLKIGISGKRNIPAAERENVKREIKERITEIRKKHKTKNFIGYTSVAIGVDTIFAEVVTHFFKQPLEIILPMPAGEYAKDFLGQDIIDFNRFIAMDNDITVINNNIPGTENERSEAYLNAGKYIVDNCDEMIFVWDGIKPKGKGGTAEVMGYYYETHNDANDFIKTVPANDDKLSNQITDRYEKANKEAIKNRNIYRIVWRSAILIGWLSVLLFAINVGYHVSHENCITNKRLVSWEFATVGIVFLLIVIAKKINFHKKYLEQRITAEKYRLLRSFYHAGETVKVSSFTEMEDNELNVIARDINNAISQKPFRSIWYSNYAIKKMLKEQIGYHRKKIKEIGNKALFFEKVNILIACSFLANLSIHFVTTVFDKHIFYSHELMIMLNILLPATYAAIEGVLYFQEWTILKKYSVSVLENMETVLNSMPVILNELSNTACFKKFSKAVNIAARVMLSDTDNWNLLLEDKENYHWVV